MEDEYNMADDVKLLLPVVETVLIKMDEVHKGMPLRDEISIDLLAVRAEDDEANAHLAKHTELMQHILTTLQQPIPEPELSFNAENRDQLDQTCEATVLLACAVTKLEEMMALHICTVDHFFGYCSKAIAKEGETESGATPSNVVDPAEPAVPMTEAEVDVVDENPTFYEAPVAEDVDVVRAGVEARDEDLPPITSAANAGDMEDDDEDADGESLNLSDVSEDLDDDDDDEDDDDNDYTIQY
ncbi:putative uncharacterized transmembrane protein DDB_G0290641 [Cynara cardunculus var. scolymus]|uniref:putative uncharacterized transmembrane protein DDB_G0290641 n=1 Tax=Cynara cardunculus var. scolymus TaxID=59895 RepID=UPI000D62BADA|nr:putative uncharacterized transmembrane protein DDB_G0290641 [Cynara cardunculus var. scolymus]